MFPPETEVRRCIDLVEAAFPRFDDWQSVNEKDPDYSGFTLWGEFDAEPEGTMSRSFFITFDLIESGWAGTLTIGKHNYFWSSADVGDAWLVGSDRRETLKDAIVELKGQMADLFAALSGSPA
jgi:hypothetical protein